MSDRASDRASHAASDRVASTEAETSDGPRLRIVRGQPSAEDLAVLSALVAGLGTGADDEPAPALRGRWNDPAAGHRRLTFTGPGGWRAASR